MPYLFVGLLLSVLTPYVQASHYEPKSVRFCYEEQSYRSYSDAIDSLSKQTKIIVNIARKACKNLGLSAELVQAPWKRCIQMFKSGQVDVLSPAIWVPERDEWGKFPKLNGDIDTRYRIWSSEIVIFTHKHSNLLWDGRFFTNVKAGIGAALGYVAYDRLKRLDVLPPVNFEIDQSFSLVNNRRLDGFAAEKISGMRILKRLGLQDDIIILDTPFIKADYFMPLSRQFYSHYPEFAIKFWQEIEKIRISDIENWIKQL